VSLRPCRVEAGALDSVQTVNDVAVLGWIFGLGFVERFFVAEIKTTCGPVPDPSGKAIAILNW
jgi:hypothetical protein